MSKNMLQNEYALKIVPGLGAKGMTWMKVLGGRLESNIVQFFTRAEQERLMQRFEAGEGDVIMMIADAARNTSTQCSAICATHSRKDETDSRDPTARLWSPTFPSSNSKMRVWVRRPPLYHADRIDFDPENREELLGLKSRAYDLVINGRNSGRKHAYP